MMSPGHVVKSTSRQARETPQHVATNEVTCALVSETSYRGVSTIYFHLCSVDSGWKEGLPNVDILNTPS